jgi:hypothetical protein
MPKKSHKKSKPTRKPKTRRRHTASASEPSKRERKWGNQFSKKYTDDEIELLGEEMIEWFRKRKNIWLHDFTAQKMIGAQRISEFAERNDYFAYLLGIAKQMQESKLFKLGKTWTGAMPIFALKNVAGWRDRQEIDHTNAGGTFGSLDNTALRSLVTSYAKLASERKAK